MRKYLLLLSLWLICAASARAKCTRPTITSIVATPDATGQQATITWMTNLPADSTIGYGIPYPGTYVSSDPTGVTSHSVTLTGLSPSLPYGYVIRSIPIAGGVPCGPGYYVINDGGGSWNHFVTHAAPAGTFDYNLRIGGPKHVVQGYSVYIAEAIGNLVGSTTNNSIKLLVSGLPNNAAIHWPSHQDWGQIGTVSTTTIPNDTVTYYTIGGADEFQIRTNQGGTTTPGAYTLTLTVTSLVGGPTHTATWPLTVDAAAAPWGITFPYGTPSSYPTIASESTYVSQMQTYGVIWCAEDMDASPRTIRPNDNANLTPVGGIQKGAWYYDGIRGYSNLSKYLNDYPTWDQCRTNIKQVYRDNYVIPNNGGVQSYLQFTEGFYIDYLRTGDVADKTAINLIDSKTYNPTGASMVGLALQRETAYSMKSDLFANLLGQSNNRYGQPTTYWLQFHKEHVLGQIEQICVSNAPTYVEAFMVGLQADVLISYYEQSGDQDPRIPVAIKCATDYLDANYLGAVTNDSTAFAYDSVRKTLNVWSASVVELNNLIAPSYAWLFKMTGDATYRTKGDAIFANGTNMTAEGGITQTLGYLPPPGNGGKQWSQQAYWGFKYLDWRHAPAAPAQLVITPSNVATFPSTVLAGNSSIISTVTNNSASTSVTIASIALSGTNAGDFTYNTTCGASLAPLASCTITSTFVPLALGSRLATITIIDIAANSPQTISLVGVGINIL